MRMESFGNAFVWVSYHADSVFTQLICFSNMAFMTSGNFVWTVFQINFQTKMPFCCIIMNRYNIRTNTNKQGKIYCGLSWRMPRPSTAVYSNIHRKCFILKSKCRQTDANHNHTTETTYVLYCHMLNGTIHLGQWRWARIQLFEIKMLQSVKWISDYPSTLHNFNSPRQCCTYFNMLGTEQKAAILQTIFLYFVERQLCSLFQIVIPFSWWPNVQ